MVKIVFFMYLCICCWQDFKDKSLSAWVFWIFGAAGICLGQGIGLDMAVSSAVGGGLILLSYLIPKQIGDGDGLFFLISGLYLPAYENLALLFYGLTLSSLFGLIVLYIKRKKQGIDGRKESLPFLPFLLPVWFGMVIL